MVEELEAARHLQQEFARHPSHTPLVQNKVSVWLHPPARHVAVRMNMETGEHLLNGYRGDLLHGCHGACIVPSFLLERTPHVAMSWRVGMPPCCLLLW